MTRTPRQLGVIALALAVVATPSSLVAACGGGSKKQAAATTTTSTSITTTSTTTTSTTSTTTTSVPPTTAAPLRPPYNSSIDTVTADDLGASWHEGCPVDPANLRMVTVALIGFDGVEHTGQVVVNADVAKKVVEAFRQMFEAGFPIRKLKPIFTQAEFEDFETPDDNSTGFSCRNAVNSSGSPSWSQHAFGHAIDINPIENPYMEGDRIIPSAGAAYTDRSDVRPGMAVSGSAIVKAFSSIGWGWGASFQDYQHFSTNGR
jgi:hypothetical protein